MDGKISTFCLKKVIYRIVIIASVTWALFLNCFIGEDIAVVRIFITPTVLVILFGFVIGLPECGKAMLKRFGIACVGLVVIAALGYHPYFLQYKYQRAKPELDSLVSQIRSGDSVLYPVRVGSFKFLGGGRKDDGSVYLWTDLDPAGPEGLVFDYTGSGYNTWSDVQLSDNCHYICID